MDNKIIEILDTFKYSCNVKSDYLDEQRINGFLPNYQLVEYLKNIISDISADNSTKSILLSGAYGTGKSYLISIVCAILSKNNLNLRPLLKKIQKYISTEKLISEAINKSNYIIVFPQDSFNSFKQSITQGIVNTSKENHLDIGFTYIYDVIIDKINQWENEFPYFYNKLKELCTDIPALIDELNNHDAKALNRFINLYPEIMAGDKLSLLSENVSLIDNIQQFEDNVIRLGYSGVLYVFDEFGRYLETNSKSIDVKEVQDVAEYCNRTGSKSALILSTHKGLFQYSGAENNKNDQIEWEKVSGRFKQIHLSNYASNIGDIVNTIVQKTEYFPAYLKENNKAFVKYQDLFYDLQLSEAPEILTQVFPLNYVSSKLLPILTTKLGQNDRTLYTFLCSEQKGALRDLIDSSKKKFETITPDKIYDYFSSNFENLNLRSYDYKVYNISQNHLRSTKLKNEKIIIKVLSLFSMVDTSEGLEPKVETLKISSGLNDDQFQKTIDSLIDKRILIYRRHTKLYELATDLTYNIDKDVDEVINKITFSKDELAKVLLDVVANDYIYPYIYNQKYQINRYLHSYYLFDFDFEAFIDSDVLDRNSDYNIIFLIRTNNNIDVDFNKLDKTLLITNGGMILNIEFLLQELLAIKTVATFPNYKDNKNSQLELDRFKHETINKIRNSISEYFSFNNSIQLYPEKRQVKSSNDFQLILKEHLEKLYYNFKIINYEMINMNKLSTPVKSARNRIINKLLSEQFDEDYFKQTGAENSIARIVLKNTGIIDNKNMVSVQDCAFKELFEELKSDIATQCNSIIDIYNKYTTYQGSYGFKKGVFSLLLAVFIKYYEKNVYISSINGNIIEEIDVTSDLINQIEENPADFEICYYEFDNDVDYYFEGLRSFLISYIDDDLYAHDPSKATIKALVQFLYERSDLMYSTEGRKYPNKRDINHFIEKISERTPKQFWFKVMPEHFDEDNLLYVREHITDMLKELYEEEQNLISYIKSLVFTSLQECVTNLEISEDNIVHSLINYDFKNQVVNDILKDKLTNKDTWLQNLTEHVSGYSYKKWTDKKQISDFNNKLQKLFNKGNSNSTIPERKKNIGLFKVLKSRLNSQLVNFGTALNKEEKIEILKQLIKEMK